MFSRSPISTKEHGTLMAVVSISIVITVLLIAIYFPFNNHYGIDRVITRFRYSVLLTLLLSCGLIAFRRIGLSLLTYLVPTALFLNWAWTYNARWIEMKLVNIEYAIPDDDPNSSFLSIFLTKYVEYCDYAFLAIIVLLFVWQAKILFAVPRLREMATRPA